MNNDGEVNILDIVRIVNIILEVDPPPTDYELWASDVNLDNSIDVADIVIIVTIIMQTYECPNLYSPCSDNLSICCPDTTGNNIVWDIQIFGAPSGNINSLWDAHILSDDDIWVVGEIRNFDGDSLHNYIRWDGNEWTQGIMNEENNPSPYPHILTSIYGFSQNDLWMTVSLPAYFNGDYWYLYLGVDGYPLSLGEIRNTWGSSSTSMYFSEYSGDIIHWNGEGFTIMETTTGSGSQYDPPYPIWDMYGLDDDHIWTISGHIDLVNPDHPRKLSFYNGIDWVDLYTITTAIQEDDELGGYIYNVWAYGDTVYVSAALNGLWRESISTGEGSYFPLDSLSSINAGWSRGKGLLGNNSHDIFTVSQIAKYAHYNGSSWYFGNEVYDYFISTEYYHLCSGMAVKDNTIILYGNLNLGGYTWIAKGTRVED